MTRSWLTTSRAVPSTKWVEILGVDARDHFSVVSIEKNIIVIGIDK